MEKQRCCIIAEKNYEKSTFPFHGMYADSGFVISAIHASKTASTAKSGKKTFATTASAGAARFATTSAYSFYRKIYSSGCQTGCESI